MTVSSPLSAVGWDRATSVIDDDHLRRMTLGDHRLEREVLEIFVRQIAIMLTRITDAEPALAAAAAHTLKGSARGIGAWRVARAAERLEGIAAGRPHDQVLADAVEQLNAAACEARAAIVARLSEALAATAHEH